MLVLTRRVGEKIAIGDEISVKIINIKGKHVKLGIDAPRDCVIHREEIYDKIKEENKAATKLNKADVKDISSSEDMRTPKKQKVTQFPEEISVSQENIIAIRDGIIGFPQLKRYVVMDLEDEQNVTMKWLQSVDNPKIGLLITDPKIYFPDYQVEVIKEELEEINLEDGDLDAAIVILTFNKEDQYLSANLRAPIILNVTKKLGKQLILTESDYQTRQIIFQKK